ncbi:MAG: hypothetical protein JW762_13090 [Dehalococcoidales bacterium]|nr:hypothetical protein [Dehalococcoidales bacterium]
MAIHIGDKIIYAFNGKDKKCVKGEIIDIWKNHNGEITDYFVALDSGLYTNVKPNYPNWCKVDDRFLCFENKRLSLSLLSSRYLHPVNA